MVNFGLRTGTQMFEAGKNFGKKLINLGKNIELVSRARIEIEAMRLMVLKAAKAMDVLGNREARVWVSMVKAMVPEKVCTIIDQAMQIHGGYGYAEEYSVSRLFVDARVLSIFEGAEETLALKVVARELVNNAR